MADDAGDEAKEPTMTFSGNVSQLTRANVSSVDQPEELPPPLPDLSYARYGVRVGAYGADLFLEGVVALVLSGLGAVVAAELIRGLSLASESSTGMIYAQTLAYGSKVSFFAVSVFNRVVYQWYSGHSIGKQLFNLRVAGLDGGDAGFTALFVRYAVFPLSCLPLGLGLLAPLWSPKKQTWHDSLARTVVLK